MRILDQNINRGRNKTLKQFEQTMWEKNNFVSLGIVQEVLEKDLKVKLIPSISYDDYDMKKGFTKVDVVNDVIDCVSVEGLTLEVDDVVLVVFTDLDSRQTITDLRRGRSKKDNFNTSTKDFHDLNYGIIINKINI